jgi:hypothetical protein
LRIGLARKHNRETRFGEIMLLLDESRDERAAVAAYPEWQAEIESIEAAILLLRDARPPDAAAAMQASSRRQTLSALDQPRVSSSEGWPGVRRLVSGAVAVVLVFAAVGAAAANSEVMSNLGLVSEVLSAAGLIDDSESNEPGESGARVPGSGGQEAADGEIGVSEAACGPWLDADRLPDAAKENNGAAKECEHPNADGVPGAASQNENRPANPGGNGGSSKPEEPPGKPAEVPSGASAEPPGKPAETGGGGGSENGAGSQKSDAPGQSKKP